MSGEKVFFGSLDLTIKDIKLDTGESVDFVGIFNQHEQEAERYITELADFIAAQVAGAFSDYKNAFGRLPGSQRTRRLMKKQVTRVLNWKFGFVGTGKPNIGRKP